MTIVDRGLRVAVAQWPPLALAWSIHGVLVLYLFFRSVPVEVPLAQRLAVGLGLLALIVFELGLLWVLALGIELALLWLPKKLPVDGLKAAGVAAALGLLVASTVKFTATSVHLKRSDLWFAWFSLRQILAEATALEALALLSVPIGTALLFAGLLAGLHRFRRRDPRVPALRLLAWPVGAAVLFALLWAFAGPLRIFAGTFVPEVAWARAALERPPYAGRDALTRDSRWGPPIRPYEAPRGATAPPAHNVVLVMLESVPWRRTVFGGGAAGVTPTLERLAEESIVFSRAYATSTHSDYAQMAILSSLHPRKYERHDYYFRIEYPRTLLWDVLDAAGYSTGMFSCQNERWGNMITYVDTPGLDILRHSLDWPREPHRGGGTESKVYEETAVAAWERWRAARPAEPFFTYLNFQANHFPYELPDDEPRPFTPHELDFPASFLQYPREKVPVMLNRFRNALAYSDRMIERVVRSLEEAGVWERTVLVVVSDHGEAFYEHGVPTHGTSLHEEQVRSLWLMRIPGEPARTIDQPVSLMDLPPTLLRVLGLPAHGNFQGRGDVLDPGYDAAGRPFPMTIQGMTLEDGLLLDDWKYIVNWDRRQRALFDLREDPSETRNLMSERPERAEELDRVLAGLLTRQLDYYREKGWTEGRYVPPLP